MYFVAYYLQTHVVFGLGLGRIDDLLEYFAGHFVVHSFAPHAGRFAADAVVSEFVVGRFAPAVNRSIAAVH